MKAIIVTISDIKNLKSLIDANQKIQDDNYRQLDYSYDYNGKEAIIEANEVKINKNIEIYMNLLGVSYSVVSEMLWDFDFAKYVLGDIYKTAA